MTPVRLGFAGSLGTLFTRSVALSGGESRCSRSHSIRKGIAQRHVSIRMVAQPDASNRPISNVVDIVSGDAPAPAVPAQLIKPPTGAFTAAVELGRMKAALCTWKVLLLGFIAGCYIAFGALLALNVGGALPGLASSNPGLQKLIFGAVGLPFGLTLVCTAGGELFTGNTALITAAYLSGATSLRSLLHNWGLSYVGNFLGCVFIAALAVVAGTVSPLSATTVTTLAAAKTALTFQQAFARGIACNWLVCLAVYASSAVADFAGKFIAIVLPVTAFVAMGFDHSIANMFFIPLAKMLGAPISWKAFLCANLIPVTLGNIIGGAVLVASVYYLGYGRK